MVDILSQRIANAVKGLWNEFASENTDLYDFPDWVDQQVTEGQKPILIIDDGKCPFCNSLQDTGGNCTNTDCAL